MDREVDREGWYRKKDRRDHGKKKRQNEGKMNHNKNVTMIEQIKATRLDEKERQFRSSQDIIINKTINKDHNDKELKRRVLNCWERRMN